MVRNVFWMDYMRQGIELQEIAFKKIISVNDLAEVGTNGVQEKELPQQILHNEILPGLYTHVLQVVLVLIANANELEETIFGHVAKFHVLVGVPG